MTPNLFLLIIGVYSAKWNLLKNIRSNCFYERFGFFFVKLAGIVRVKLLKVLLDLSSSVVKAEVFYKSFGFSQI